MKLYRYEIEYTSEDGSTNVHLMEHQVVRETEASYCIRPHYRDKWIRKTSHNGWAQITKQRAKDHFIRRTSKRIQWFDFWKEECEKALEIIKNKEVQS